jgi:O-antigen chain-terminating methyltransferase
MSDHFYRAFEDKHRGSRELIKERLKAYLPFILPLLQAYPQGQAIDLGCGRGEWLELLTEVGLRPIGIDLDDGMLAACRELGLAAEQGDAIAHLIGLPDESQVLVSAFHMVEHIAFEQLQTLVQQALRVLKPGGLLIMETPNPENILVATCNFYVDPSHERPIPPMLLSFLAEYVGFSRVKTVRLQEPEGLLSKTKVNLRDVLTGVSPDYAVVAQKKAVQSILNLSAAAFDPEVGLDLGNLVNRWDVRFNVVEEISHQVIVKAQQANAATELALLKAEQANSAASEAHRAASEAHAFAQLAHTEAKHLHAHASNIEARLQEMQASASWQITAPLRWIGTQVQRLKREGIQARSVALVKKALRKAMQQIQRRPKLLKAAKGISQKLGIYQRLKKINVEVDNGSARALPTTQEYQIESDAAEMSVKAERIYTDLKARIELHQKGGH